MMYCPTCHKSLKLESLHGQTVDRCVACNGLWFDHSELGPIVRHTQPPTVPVEPVACSSGIACPECDESLASFNYAHDSGVFINKCPSCSGIWLESGQLELIAQYRSGSPTIQRLGDAFADEMRASNRLRIARQLLRSRHLSGIVAIGYLIFIVFGMVVTGVWQFVFLLGFLLFPMVFIWFPDGWATAMGGSHAQ